MSCVSYYQHHKYTDSYVPAYKHTSLEENSLFVIVASICACMCSIWLCYFVYVCIRVQCILGYLNLDYLNP